jgi:hypothetical protein
VRSLKIRNIRLSQAFPRESLAKTTLKAFIRKLVSFLGVGRYVGSFAGVSYFTSTIGELKNRAAVALPGIGIFVHPKDARNISLLRHEFGHMLQAKKWGKIFFYRYVARESVNSVRRSNRDSSFNHQHTWTEWTANRLSYYFFKRPNDWDMKSYPIYPPLENREGTDMPEFLRFTKPPALVRHNIESES